MIFKDRRQAGKELSRHLLNYKNENPYVLALPRGGVPVAYEVAKFLNAPLDVIIARKIGDPDNPEFGVGAIAEGDVQILDESTISVLGIDNDQLFEIVERERTELHRRINIYRDGQPPTDLRDHTAILVDDGLATGVTAKAAIESIKQLNPQRIVFAVPVCPADIADNISFQVYDFVCLNKPLEFIAVCLWYEKFNPVSDKDIVKLISKSKKFVTTQNV
jgi:predicted phosphoribosyltransferase